MRGKFKHEIRVNKIEMVEDNICVFFDNGYYWIPTSDENIAQTISACCSSLENIKKQLTNLKKQIEG